MEFTRVEEGLWPLRDVDGNYYGEKQDGYISFGDVALNLLGRQSQYTSRYIDGKHGGYPNLGGGIRFINLDEPSGNYHSIGIHPDDIEEFIRRFEAYKALTNSGVQDEQGRWIQLTNEALVGLRQYLESIGAFSTN